MENTSSRASKGLKIIESISNIIRNALILSSNKARELKPTEEPLDVDEDEDDLMEL